MTVDPRAGCMGTCPRNLLGGETIHLVLEPEIPSLVLLCSDEAGGGDTNCTLWFW